MWEISPKKKEVLVGELGLWVSHRKLPIIYLTMHEVHMKELPLNGHLVLLHSQMHGTRQIKVEDGKQLLDIT